MIPDEKYVEIAKGLLQKTRKKEAQWKPVAKTPMELAQLLGKAAAGMSGAAALGLSGAVSSPTKFVLPLRNAVVQLDFASPKTQPDKVSLQLLDGDNRLAGSWEVEEGEIDWDLAIELYQEVSKQVNKWDKVLEEVEAFIGKP